MCIFCFVSGIRGLEKACCDTTKVDVMLTTNLKKKQVTNLSIFKGDLPDQRHTLVLGPGVGQVKVVE